PPAGVKMTVTRLQLNVYGLFLRFQTVTCNRHDGHNSAAGEPARRVPLAVPGFLIRKPFSDRRKEISVVLKRLPSAGKSFLTPAQITFAPAAAGDSRAPAQGVKASCTGACQCSFLPYHPSR